MGVMIWLLLCVEISLRLDYIQQLSVMGGYIFVKLMLECQQCVDINQLKNFRH